jgi:hypothetical protein
VVVRFGLLVSAVILLVGLEWAVWGWFVEWGDRESFPLTAGVFAAVSLSVVWVAVLCVNVVERALRMYFDARRYQAGRPRSRP